MNRLPIVAALLLLALPLPGQESGPPLARPALSPLDVFELEVADDPRISPDGRSIVYVRRSFDLETDRSRGHLWIIDVESGRHRPLLREGTGSSPRWSPDSGRVAFLREGQIWMKHLDGAREEMPITRVRDGAGSPVWSPSGDRIAFLMTVPAKSRGWKSIPQPPEGASWAEAATVIDRLVYRRDGAGYVEGGHRHLFIVPSEGGTARQLTEGDFDHAGPPSWGADGRRIYISANRDEDWEYASDESEVWEVEVEGGAMRAITDHAGPDGSPQVSPDGRWLSIIGNDASRLGHRQGELTVIELATGRRRLLTGGFDRGIGRAVWSGDSRGIFVQYDDRGRSCIGWVALPDGEAESPEVELRVRGIGGTSLGRPYSGGAFSVAGDGTIAHTMGRHDRPADVAILTSGGDAPRLLTKLNEDLLGERTLGAIREITVPSPHDGLPIQAWLVFPPDFDSRGSYPLILEINGGPFANYGPRFSAEVQLFAAAGNIVLYVNPRGSTSYGADFANEIHHAYPGHDYDDLIGCVDAVISEGYVDTDHLFVTGGSGGGVLTAWIVGKTDRFRAAVVAKPVIHWASFVLTADFSNYFAKYWFPGPPWEHPEQYWARSPLSLVGNVSTPTMLLTGEEDYRTPMSETEQYYQALKLRKVETAMVRIPGAGHGIAARPSNLIRKVAYILAWFERHSDAP
ncbi:MAG: prolyl oligopeptidase family serine peptidase [Planctomycetota bacterium]